MDEITFSASSDDQAFRRSLEASPMGVHLYQLTPDNRLVFTGANPAADRILGVDNQQFVGMTIEEAFPPLAQTEVPGRYRAADARVPMFVVSGYGEDGVKADPGKSGFTDSLRKPFDLSALSTLLNRHLPQ